MTNRSEQRNERVHELPAGSYYIGDPCYVMGDDWEEYLEAWYLGKTWRGQPIAAFSTMGDGTHQDDLGREYSVDSVILAAIPAERVTDPVMAAQLGQMITFPAPFRCSRDRRGRIRFGDIVIRTEG